MKDSKAKCGKASICNTAVAGGVVWGLSLMMLAYVSLIFGMGTPIVKMLSSLFAGYHSSVFGGIVGFMWGFGYAFVAGAFFASLYNWCRCCCPCGSCTKDRCNM